MPPRRETTRLFDVIDRPALTPKVPLAIGEKKYRIVDSVVNSARGGQSSAANLEPKGPAKNGCVSALRERGRNPDEEEWTAMTAMAASIADW